MYAHSSVYVFINCKLESFIILMLIDKITKLNATGLIKRWAEGGMRSILFRSASLSGCGRPLVCGLFNGCKSINFCNNVWKLCLQWSVWTQIMMSMCKWSMGRQCVNMKISNIMTRKLNGANPIIQNGLLHQFKNF